LVKGHASIFDMLFDQRDIEEVVIAQWVRLAE
jgi:hypothetical protein